MHLRLPVVAAVVVLAAGAAGFRALHPKPVSQSAATVVFADAPPAVALGRQSAPRRPPATIVVYVAGRVARGGLYTLPASARGADALRAAGGPTSDADLVAVNLAARLSDGDEVAVPALGAPSRRTTRSRAAAGRARPAGSRHARKRRGRRRTATGTASTADAGSGEAAAVDAEPTEIVDLNAASAEELQTLPGIGPALAERIVTVRDRTGPFGSPDDLLDVGGMTQGKLDAIVPFVTVR